MRVAIIGYGNQANHHARALAKTPGVMIAGVGAQTLERAQSFANRWCTQARKVDELMADESIDAVIIASPTATHAAISCQAFAHGKHVLCECPVAHSLFEADAMIAASRRVNRVLQIGLIHRFEAPYEHLVSAIKSGRFGHIYAVETSRSSAHLSDGSHQSHYGDAIEELLTFDLHFLSWAFGRPASITAQSINEKGKSRHVVAVVAYPNLLANCTASTFLPQGFAFTESMKLHTEAGLVELSLRLRTRRIDWVYEITRPNASPEKIEVAAVDPTIAQIGHFVRVATGQVDACKSEGAAAREMLELTLAADMSARTKSTITLA